MATPTNNNPRKSEHFTAGNTSSASTAAYEVFMSFCGKDTRYGFTDFLYTYLQGAGIRTFRDDNELRVGEEIGPELVNAIKDSKISIPIFSKNYASSKWCLLELARIVECHTAEGQMIFPIFYDVGPDEVRHQSGSYEEAFHQHNEHFDGKIVQGWKEALKKVGKLKGLELKKETYGLQGKLVKKVVEMVLLELRKDYTHVPDTLVGLDHHIRRVKGLLNVDSNGVQIVGIHGMGGLGKTTIAKVVYNQLCERFECHCFLEDVREKSQPQNGIVNLQNQLLSKILNREVSNIVNVYDGIDRIKSAVSVTKVLIVLDDVDEKSQFDNFVGECHLFGRGTRIIVTTRNKEVLDAIQATCNEKGLPEAYRSYEPELMDRDHSLQLFSKYAFMRDFPPQDYLTLSKEIVSTAAGLPLVLMTIGSSLFGKEDKLLWKEKSRELAKRPHQEVLGKLKISFEALNDMEKHIFLDIACLFIGEDKTVPCYMWDDCEFYPRNGINALVLRSLVKVGDDNTLRMHDQLRDLGRQIVREESLNQLGKRSRLWCPEEALDVFEKRMGTQKVEALSLALRAEATHCLVGDDFGQLPNLRFLRVGYADLHGDFKHHFSNLRWLQWGCPGNFMPTNFLLKNLVILDLSWSKITDDWEGWIQIKMARKLKVLNLSGCKALTRAPCLSAFATLERLILRYCLRLEEINPTIGNVKNLKVLHLYECPALRVLDCSPFSSLESLDVTSCQQLRRVDGLGVLEFLESLELKWCISLETIPDVSNLKNLKKVSFLGLNVLKDIFGHQELNSLESLDIHGCEWIERLPVLSNLNNLREIHAWGCAKLSEIQGLEELESLELLDIHGCVLLEKIPVLSNLNSLRWIQAWGCAKLSEIQGLEELNSLELLDIHGCESIEKLPVLSNLKNLRGIYVWGCAELSEIQGLVGLKSLELLDIHGCKSLEKLCVLSNLNNLRELHAWGCEKLSEIQGLEELKSLELLDIHGSKSLEKLSVLSNLNNLREIHAWGCVKLSEIRGLEQLKSLELLEIHGCESLEKLPVLSNLNNLRELHAWGCAKISEIQGLEELKSLELFDIHGCELLEKLPVLSNLNNLRGIHAWGCAKLSEIQGLIGLKSLELLNIHGCKSLEKLCALSNLNNLRELHAWGCEKLREIQGLEGLKYLELLDIHGCKSLEKLSVLSNHSNLREIHAWGCVKLSEMQGLEELKSLKLLEIHGCESLEKLPVLSNLDNLREIHSWGCAKLSEIQGVEELKSLELLDIHGCESLEKLPVLSNLNNLTGIHAWGCAKLSEIQGLEGMKSLKLLDIHGCKSLEKLCVLSNLNNLRELHAWGCEKLREIQGLEELKSLELLDIHGCSSLEKLSDLSNLKNLRAIHVWGCDKLSGVHGVE